MIDRLASAAALAAALGALACMPAAAQTANGGPGDPQFVGPSQSEAEEKWAEARRTAAAAPEIDFSQPVAGLQDAILRAYWQNPRVLGERARKRSADFRLPQARALYGPRIDYQVDYSYRRDRIELQPDRFRTASGWSGTVSAIVDQPLFTFGRLAANERRANAEIGFQREALRYTEQQVILAAIEAYVAVLRDREAVSIAQENLDRLSEALSYNVELQSARETTVVDVQQVQTRRELAAAELAVARGSLESSEGRFLAVVGSPPGEELAQPNPLVQPVPTLAEALEVALAENPLVDAAEYREQISRAAVDAAIAEQLPRVDLRGRADLAPVSPYDDQLRQTTYLGQVVVSGPLFTSGLLAARQNEAEAANDADWRLIDAARRDLIEELTTAWSTRQASGESLGSYAAAVTAARAAFEGAVEQQKAGFSTTLDVLILAADLLTVRNSLNRAEADNYLAQARILYALGMLDLPDLMPSEPAYDADAHLEKVDGHGSVFPITPILRTLDGISYEGTEPRPTRDPALGANEVEER